MRQVSCSFVIPKLIVGAEPLILLRIDPKWFDISLVGGHVAPEDGGDWLRTAIREIEEELAPLRHGKNFELDVLTGDVRLAAEWSKVKEKLTSYTFRYFSMFFCGELDEVFQLLAANALVTWVRERELIEGRLRKRLSAPIRVLIEHLEGSLKLIPVSWPEVVAPGGRYTPAARPVGQWRAMRS